MSSIKVLKQQNIIDLENIVVQFPSRDGSLFGRKKFTAVNNISLGIRAGETIGLVGESGCGKSTLANVIIGLQKPTSGVVKFNGLEMQYGSAEARRQFGRQVSVIFQDPATALNPRMRVLDILRDPLDIHNVLKPHEREKRVYELLSRVGLPRSAALVEPTRLSGGQKQRVAIARALALNPKLIVADEPTSALDVSVRAQVLNLLADLKKELNLAMVFISHDIQTVRQVSDRIVVMFAGQIMEQGTTQEIFDNPNIDYTKKLLGAAPSLL
ncbi:peptide/nickel transport system ATP-binding protein [Volucribacter psittacicida]|uniref:Peptide/nickel transport system ATP-binding protein n=1 Tax=Volucribacter psittacicida TaxID=203482 RepID=A0A4V2PBM3_9PAST|nr:ATP-binding cassette domain-containing protein [Volucribacter psittacicida]TCJ97995.1 peptide/nickel transport system ATP-binding protein [Volucribacter psittacicida]